MAGGDHNATVKVVYAGNVGHGRSGSDVQQVGICAGSRQASDQTILKHIGATTSVFADNDAGGFVVAVALAQSVIIPAQEATNLVSVVGSQSDSGFTTESISPKIFSHYNSSYSPKVNF